MEVKVYFKDGTVEAHHVPEVAGTTYSIFDKDTGRERGRCGTDLIADVVGRFELTDDGFVISSRVYTSSVEDFAKVATVRRCVVPMPMFRDAKFVLVDNEQVWPCESDNMRAGEQKLEKNW